MNGGNYIHITEHMHRTGKLRKIHLFFTKILSLINAIFKYNIAFIAQFLFPGIKSNCAVVCRVSNRAVMDKAAEQNIAYRCSGFGEDLDRELRQTRMGRYLVGFFKSTVNFTYCNALCISPWGYAKISTPP